MSGLEEILTIPSNSAKVIAFVGKARCIDDTDLRLIQSTSVRLPIDKNMATAADLVTQEIEQKKQRLHEDVEVIV